jgi:hypothetical protein
VNDAGLVADLRRELEALGVVMTAIRVERVDHVPRTAAGKAPLVRAYHS